MSVNTLLGATEVLLRELGKPEMQAHVGKLPELSERIKSIQEALEALAAKQLEVDQANSRMVKPEPLISLKREAAAKLEVLVDYLRVMSTKDVQTYGGLRCGDGDHQSAQRHLQGWCAPSLLGAA